MEKIEALKMCIINTHARINDLTAQLQDLTAYLDKLELMYEAMELIEKYSVSAIASRLETGKVEF